MTHRCHACGQSVELQSTDERNLLFGVIGMAAANWPEHHPFQPDGRSKKAQADHLRAWLLIEVGHCDGLHIGNNMLAGGGIEKAIEVGKFFCNGKKHFRLYQTRHGFKIVRPESIAKGEIKTDRFREVATAIYEITETITGINPEVYKEIQEARHQKEVA